MIWRVYLIANIPLPTSNVSPKSTSVKSKSSQASRNIEQSGTLRGAPKQLHHPDHNAVRKSTGPRHSSEMWIPLSGTPEPVERAQTRVLVRSTDGLEVPTVSSSESDPGDALFSHY